MQVRPYWPDSPHLNYHLNTSGPLQFVCIRSNEKAHTTKLAFVQALKKRLAISTYCTVHLGTLESHLHTGSDEAVDLKIKITQYN